MEEVKFKDPLITAKGDTRGYVDFTSYKNLWFNTGTLCNLTCSNCYIESSPKNDRLQYITKDDVIPFLEELISLEEPVDTIGFTGGEPFLNPNMVEILDETLKRGFKALVLTNAFRVINRVDKKLMKLQNTYQDQLRLRISLDHYTKEIHEKERGENTFDKTLEAFKWLFDNKFNLSIAGRSLTGETQEQAISGYQSLLDQFDIKLKLDPTNVVIFPEMDEKVDVPEITTECWGILNKSPNDQMCATERMIVRKKGSNNAQVQACTLLAYDEQFNMGITLKEAKKRVQLNHPHCAKFCVLGGASCSST